MEQAILVAFLNNAALLLVLSVIYEITYYLPPKHSRMKPVYGGLMISMICIAIMMMPLTFLPGVIYDTRSILISVTALIFGPIPTAITAAVAIILRLVIGGAGTLPGIAVIMGSALIGLAWRRWVHEKSGKRRWLSVFFMSITVHIVMLACMFLLPYPDSINVIRVIALPVMLVYPLASLLLSLLLFHQQEYQIIQDELKGSEERFRSLFDKAPLGYQSLDIDGNFIDINQQWMDTLGYSRDEVVGKWFGDFLSPDEIETFLRMFPIFKLQGQIHSEFVMLHKNGNQVFVSFEGKIGYGKDGKFCQTHCILQDITKQRAAEEKLRVSEEKNRCLFETMAQGVVYQAADGSIISANPAAERILGRSLDQMQGRTSMDPGWKAINEDGSEMAGSEHPAMIALRTGKPYGPFIMGVFLPQINDHVWLSIDAIPLYHQGETAPYQVYATFQDITAVRKANQNYQQLFSEMIDAFALHEIICDNQGKPVDYRFLTVNPAFEHMTGLKSADILGKTVMEVLPDTEPYWIEKFGRVALTGEPVRFGDYAISSDKHYEISAYQPSPNQFACTFSDVTQRVQAEEEKERILSRLRSLLDYSPSPIVIIDEKGRIIEMSAVAKKIMRLSDEDVLAEDASKTAPPEITEKVLRIMSQSSGNCQFLEDIDVFELDGKIRYFESRLFPIHTPGHNKRLFGYLAIDVTQRIAAEHALKENEEKYSSYIENAPYGIFIVNDKGQFIEVNSFATALTGYGREQLVKMSIVDITSEESLESAMRHLEKLINTGYLSIELKYAHRNGSIRWLSVDSVKLSEHRYLAFASDISEKKDTEENLQYLSNHDFLTGLYNRRFYEAELQRLDIPSQLPLTIMMGDINGVKLVNDAFGHTEGDRLIVDSAKILSSCCRKGDILARIGGDEFGILMPKTDNAAAMDILSKIYAALNTFDANAPQEKFMHSVSLGFATKAAIDEDVSQISRIAEQYIYERKLLEHNSSHSAIISSIKATMNEKSHETAEHAGRLVIFSKAIAIGLNLPQIDRDGLELLATLHDIGKVGISESILTNQGKLSEDEWVEMRRHPEIGYRIAISTPELIPIAESILCHHEWWDGRGYPQGMSRDNIPLLSRILSIADAYDVMTHDRPYRHALTHEEAIAEIMKCAGTQFDPQIAQIMIETMQ